MEVEKALKIASSQEVNAITIFATKRIHSEVNKYQIILRCTSDIHDL